MIPGSDLLADSTAHGARRLAKAIDTGARSWQLS